MPHLHATNSRAIVPWIEGTPFVTQIGFEIGVKIHRSSRIFESDIRQMTGNITSWDIERPAKCNTDVREIPANAVSTIDHILCGQIRSSRTKSIFDIRIYPIRDRLNALKSMWNLAEPLPGKIQKFIRIAVAARQSVSQEIRGQFIKRNRLAFMILRIKFAGNCNDRVM